MAPRTTSGPPRALALADKGLMRAMAADEHLRAGLNVDAGQLTCGPVAEAPNLPYIAAEPVLEIGP